MPPAATDSGTRLGVPTRRAVGDAERAGARRSPGRRTRSSQVRYTHAFRVAAGSAPTGDETPADHYIPEVNRRRVCNPAQSAASTQLRGGALTADRGERNAPPPPGKGSQKAWRLRSAAFAFIVPGQELSVFSELFRALAARRTDASTS